VGVAGANVDGTHAQWHLLVNYGRNIYTLDAYTWLQSGRCLITAQVTPSQSQTP
jgi:hypothetical protein